MFGEVFGVKKMFGDIKKYDKDRNADASAFFIASCLYNLDKDVMKKEKKEKKDKKEKCKSEGDFLKFLKKSKKNKD